MLESSGLFIDGKWLQGHGREMRAINPATNDILWQGNAAVPEQVDMAVNAARQSLSKWADLAFDKRLQFLEAYTQVLKDRQADLIQALSQNTGKPLWEAKTEIDAMVGKLAISLEAYADRCKELTKDMPGYTSKTRHKPHGVVCVLAPFNFPGHLPNGHIIPALLAGNTVVLKPSELTTYFTIEMLKCWEAANLPTGVLNLILGFSDIGQALVANKDIDGVFFTGSFNTGQQIAKASLEFPGRILALEMGGNNPLVVYKPKDIPAAVYHTIQSAFATAGQRCTCARRLIIQRDEAGSKFLDKLCEAVAKIKVGHYTQTPEPFMGPLISEHAANKVYTAYEDIVKNGATVLLAMRHVDGSRAFLSPALLDVTGIPQDDEEIFGPLLRVIWVDDFSQAIREANNTTYGLAAGLITDDAQLYAQFTQHVNAGIINWNRPTTGSSSSAPFGGIGRSGNHRPSAYYAADYCAYPVASMETATLELPKTLTPGIEL